MTPGNTSTSGIESIDDGVEFSSSRRTSYEEEGLRFDSDLWAILKAAPCRRIT